MPTTSAPVAARCRSAPLPISPRPTTTTSRPSGTASGSRHHELGDQAGGVVPRRLLVGAELVAQHVAQGLGHHLAGDAVVAGAHAVAAVARPQLLGAGVEG